MRRLSMVYGVGLMLTLVASPAAMADPSWAKVSAELTRTGSTNVTDLAVSVSGSYAYVEDSLGNWDSSAEWANEETDTSASAVIPTATGYAQTAYLHLDADSVAAPPVGVESFSGLNATQAWLNGAYQEWTFKAFAAGDVEFNFASHVKMDLQTDSPGEEASGTYEVWLGLSSASGGWNTAWIADGPRTVQDGADYLFEDSSGLLSLELPFSADETGKLMMQVRTFGSANTAVVPVPPAVLLGLLGVSAAGVRLRRHA